MHVPAIQSYGHGFVDLASTNQFHDQENGVLRPGPVTRRSNLLRYDRWLDIMLL
jgi:hypothetical protein